ncbi:Cupin -type [Pyrrhoderma noxium]|uniref:Cupin-type n=1 Tax=Pyrrhoderma noxium TaxID=2282107 RepID=A0A286UUV0_9AGAM|nr:Cupin -type [Pyrrhoderma noxium]
MASPDSRSLAKKYEEEARERGFKQVFTWTDSPDAYYPPHSHRELTTHLIVQGQFTISYPQDPNPTRATFGPGVCVDVDAGRLHEVWIGEEGCTYVIGE